MLSAAPVLPLLAAAPAPSTTLFIKQPRGSELRANLARVSDPSSPDWGKWLNHAEVLALQAPLESHVALVAKHLRAVAPPESIEWSTARDKVVVRGLNASSLPAALAPALDFVAHGGGAAPMARRASSTRAAEPAAAAPAAAAELRSRGEPADPAADPQGCLFERVTPECLRKAYGVDDTHATFSGFNAQTVVVNQGFKPSDLAAFEREHKLPAQKVVKEVGKNDDQAGDEATLDVQFIIAMGQQVPTWWVYIDGHVANPFASWLTWASNTSEIPYVHSLSVGEPEAAFASDNGGSSAVARMNDELAALGARGVSILFASGDSGYVREQKYPASSPYVTAVGGVTLGAVFRLPHISVDGETTGGFSSLDANAAPTHGAYQAAAVEHYLTKTSGTRPKADLNASRRCVPDLAAYSTEYYIVQDGGDTVIGGTSAATPVVAGMVSLLNDALLGAGSSPLGFLNPFLYQNQDAFLDVTHGGNGGYDAVAGYDPASGLGTFSPTTFSTLRERALKRRAALAAASLVEKEAGAPAPPPSVISCAEGSGGGGEGRLLLGLRHSAAQRRALDEAFWAAADPASAAYRKHLSVAQLRSLVGAAPRAAAAATAWLRTLGVPPSVVRATPTGDALEAVWPCAGPDARPPRVPAALRDDVTFAVLLRPRPPTATTAAPDATANGAARPAQPTAASASYGPAAQKAAYGVPSGLRGKNKANWQMVWGTGTFGYREADLDLFFKTYAPEASTADVHLDVDNKWHGSTGDNFVEGELDASYAAAFAPGVRTVVANTNTSAATEDGEAFGGALLAFLIELNGRDEVPGVLSMSLGSLSFGACDRACAALAKRGGHTYKQCWSYLQDQRQACMFGSAEVETRIDAELAKLGLRGVTVTAASGDGGSHFAFGPFSGGVGGALDELICDSLQMPVYPASSPYVLAVGGTQWESDDMYGPTCAAKRPCGWSSGGGGFSWTAAAPPYQANTSAAYLASARHIAPKTSPAATTFNAHGRAYPDLSALAQFGIPLCTYGGCSGSGGTSASAPTVAGMLSLINDARLAAGKPRLGFVNTRLYQLMADPATYAECFADVGIDKLGSLWDCNTYSTCTGCADGGGGGSGFVAVPGWDAQTGFGQPLFEGLLKHLSD